MIPENYDEELFNRKMSQWVGEQGLLFQLTHGGSSSIFSILASLAFRALLLFAVVAGIVFHVLKSRVTSDSYREGLTESFIEATGSEEAVISSFSASSGRAAIKSITATGGVESFFHELKLQKISIPVTNKSLLLGSKWDTDVVTVSEGALALRAGHESDDEARAVWDRMFLQFDNFSFEEVRFKDLSITWGYSAATQGNITGAQATLARASEDEWNLVLTGGEFGHSWISKAEIKTIEATLSRTEGLQILRGELLLAGGGVASFSADVSVAAQPLIDGSFEASDMDVSTLLFPELQRHISGRLDLEAHLSGSTNGQGGVITDGKFRIAEESLLTFRRGFRLVMALNLLDSQRTFQRISFEAGSFLAKISSSGIKFTEVSLQNGVDYSLTGSAEVRKPDFAEIAELLDITEEEASDSQLLIAPEAFEPDFSSIGLKEAASFSTENDQAILGTMGEDGDRMVLAQQVKAAMNTYRFFPDLVITLGRNGLSGAPHMLEDYEVDPESLRIKIPFQQGGAIDEATTDFANRLTEESRPGSRADQIGAEIDRLLQP